jgi:hypothetical protein
MSGERGDSEWKRLLMLNADDIKYPTLAEDVLEHLALSEEPYIATLSLAELVGRHSPRARPVIDKLLSSSPIQVDRYLRAAALEGMYELDPDAALQYMGAHAAGSDPYVVNSMVELILANEPDPEADPARSAIRAVAAQLRAQPHAEEISAQQRSDFLDVYAKGDI